MGSSELVGNGGAICGGSIIVAVKACVAMDHFNSSIIALILPMEVIHDHNVPFLRVPALDNRQ